MRQVLLFAFTVCVITASIALAATVDVRIATTWTETSLLAEASEVVSALQPENFWSFLDMTNPVPQDVIDRVVVETGEAPHSANASSPQIEQYSKALQIIPGLLFSQIQQKLARAELAARAFSPKIAAHHDAAMVAINGSANRENKLCLQDAFIEIGEKRTVCDVKDLEMALKSITDCPAVPAATFDNEHVLTTSFPPTAAVCQPHVTLYGVVGTSRTAQLLDAVRRAVKAGRIGTVWFRHYSPPTPHLTEPLSVMGYGVTLDVKNLEYKAVDEKSSAEENLPVVQGVDVKRLLSRYPTLAANLTRFAKKAATSTAANLDLKVWEVQKLGYQAAHVILSDPNPMSAFVDLTENFPTRVGRISMLESSPELDATTAALEQLQAAYGEGQTRLWLDGRPLDAAKQDLFALLAAIRSEEALANSVLRALTGQPKTMHNHDAAVRSVLTCPVKSMQEGEKPRLLVSEHDVNWINNLEEDEMYGNLDRRIQSILQPGPYGQPRFVRRNIINVIYIIDPTNRDDIEAFASFMRLYQQGAAMRFGVMFKFPPVDPSVARQDSLLIMVATVLEHITKKAPAETAMVLIRALYNLQPGVPLSIAAITEASSAFGGRGVDGPSPTAEDFIKVWNKRIDDLGLTTFPAAIFNGIVQTDRIEEVVYRRFSQEFGRLKQMVMTKKLNDGINDMYAAVHGDSAVRRYQPAVFDSNVFESWDAPQKQTALYNAVWLHSADHNLDVCALSHVVTFNGSSVEHLTLVAQPLKFLKECANGACARSRLTLMPCDAGALPNIIAALLHAASSLSERKRAAFIANFVDKFVPLVESDATLADAAVVKQLAEKVFKELGAAYSAVLSWNADYALGQLNAGCNALATKATSLALFHTNGRVVFLDNTFTVDDFAALESMERTQRGSPMAACVQALDFSIITEGKVSAEELNAEFYATKVAILQSVLAGDLILNGARQLGAMPAKSQPHGFSVGGKNNATRHELVVVVDPISRSAQKVAALAQYLIKALDVAVRVHFNPPQRVQKVPIKNYYHFVADTDLHFDGGALVPPHALIKNLPTNVLLTLGIDDPEGWMVFADVAKDDLDNLVLKEDAPVVAVYSLQCLVITGTCIDTHTRAPPRGLPIVLTDSRGSRDTLVMSNYGYFQLQGNPGFASLSIQDGRATSIFQIATVNDGPSSTIPVASFGGSHVVLHVNRKPGMESVDFLDEKAAAASAGGGEESKGFLSSLFGSGNSGVKMTSWPPTAGDRPTKPERPTLNILSLASGHLYERFLRIMFSSVMKSSHDKYGANTTRIKFWLIENPMSPRFKRLLPMYAAKFGFEYGLVKYKWPHWLTRQTEKQRMIWAYKVLFLDVLFPLDVEKIIFVDADQIVNADLHELYNLDLEGRAVGYTPFCRAEAREETKGFRFWDSGYWKDHLRGKPYHISAIYVVDLIKLRQIAAGDGYRMTYDNLAQDPNSLANLDQDLPNFAQHQVPIFSLPEEWLWCETWCSDKSKKAAKTIDLCNNPLTKTPKLENAKRIIPEWEAMDKALTEFEKAALGEE